MRIGAQNVVKSAFSAGTVSLESIPLASRLGLWHRPEIHVARFAPTLEIDTDTKYDMPSCGRFISEDPARDGANWFSYCGGDPVNSIDPHGQDSVQQAFWISASAAFFSGVMSLLCNIGGPSKAQLLAGAVGFLARIMIGVLEASMENSLEPLTQREFVEKLQKKSLFGALTGMSTGVGIAIAASMGQRAGLVMIELWYIDNFDEVPV
jgi:hypothetical protein